MPQVTRLPLSGSIFFDVTTHNPTTGAVSDVDGSQVPQYEVFEDDTDTPIVGPTNLTKRTSKTGDYRGRIYVDSASGFQVGRWYNTVVSGTVNAIAGKTVPLTFQVAPIEAIPGIPDVNVTHLNDSALQQSGGYIGIDWNLINNKTAGAQLTNTSMGTAVSLGHPARTQVSTTLSDINLDQLAKIAVPSSFAASVHLSSILGQIADAGAGTFDRTTDSQQAIRDRGDAAWGDAGSGSDLFGTLSAIKLKTDNLPASFPTNFASLGINTLGNISKVVVAGTIEVYKNDTPQTGDAFARVGAPIGASISADIAAVQADSPNRITKNTALTAFPFLMVDSADHVTPKTGLAITATRSLDGAAFAACANAATEIGNGWYKINLDATDLNGTTIILKFSATGADTRNIGLITQPT